MMSDGSEYLSYCRLLLKDAYSLEDAYITM